MSRCSTAWLDMRSRYPVLRLRRDGRLLVEGESPGAVLTVVDAGHARDERGLILVAVGAAGVDKDRVIVAEGDEPLIGDVVAPPWGYFVPGLDDGLAVEDLAVGEDHDAVAGHNLPVEVCTRAIAEGCPSLMFEVEQLFKHGASPLFVRVSIPYTPTPSPESRVATRPEPEL